MIARVNVGGCRIGVVHGDADSLAGWRFDVTALDDPENQPWIVDSFSEPSVDIFASTHTCLPALRRYPTQTAHGLVINNGAAGMPNFSNLCFGVLTRDRYCPPIQEVLYGKVHQGVQRSARLAGPDIVTMNGIDASLPTGRKGHRPGCHTISELCRGQIIPSLI